MLSPSINKVFTYLLTYRKGYLMLHHSAGATIQVVNSVNYKCTPQEKGNKRMAINTDKHKSRVDSGSVVECLTGDREAAGSSLTGLTALWSLSKTHLS